MTQPPLPYSTLDLDPNVVTDKGPPEQIRCFVRGCRQYLEPATRRGGPACRQHGIRCYRSGTYSYPEQSRNAIVAADLFGGRLVGHPDKHNTRDLGNENSEDTLSWNVFRSFQEAGALGMLATEVFGLPASGEPQLYLWGLKLSDDSLSLWPLLTTARQRFENELPVDRPLTEPDIALYVPGQYLALIEAKFTSGNKAYEAGRLREGDHDLTFEELLRIYWDPSLRVLDLAKAKARKLIHYQLWRNMIFAEWMSQHDSPTTQAYHFNLVRDGYEVESAAEFHELLHDGFRNRFRRVTWEAIYQLAKRSGPGLDRLCTYMETKTTKLKKAFRILEPSGVTS